MNKFKNIVQWLLIIIGTIMVAIFLRVFIFATFSIPTPSMEPAIIPGDHVVVSKLTPGPRIISNFFSMEKEDKPIFERIDGFNVKRNDILIFNYPYSDWSKIEIDLSVFYAKRCVAIPGDTFYIENAIYKVKNCSDTLGNYENQYRFSQIPDENIEPAIFNSFPFDGQYNWSAKNFGPIYLPRKNDSLEISQSNITLYRNLICYETGKEVDVKENAVLLGDSIIHCYKFTRNYYFMAGDYVFDSKDSRYWGLLPEDHIVGKVAFVWSSIDKNTDERRWERFLKKVK